MTAPGYKTCITYEFEVDGEGFAVIDWGDRRVDVEETRKNGQEDCHFFAELYLNEDGKWKMDDWSRKNAGLYFYSTTADGIEAHLNKWGPPPQ